MATIAPRLSPRNPIGWLSFATGLSQGGLHCQRPPLLLRTTASPLLSSSVQLEGVPVGIGEQVMEALGRGSGHRCDDGMLVALR
jgi:hypothetical protein